MKQIDQVAINRRLFLKGGLVALASATGIVRADAAPLKIGTGSEILALSATELSRAIQRKAVSCTEVMKAYLGQIARLNPVVNAIVSLQDQESLLRQAAERDAMLARGQRMGWMHGFPHAVKELSDVAGMPSTQGGNPALRTTMAKTDAIHVERMRKAGAIFIGKTNAPEFGLGCHTVNRVFGTTGNAFDSSKSAGGSSGGAAVSVALHMQPVADGSDLGGSIRNPCGWNNLYGLRPSFGQVPFGPTPEVFFQQLGYDGAIARSVNDVAMLLSVQSGYDARAPLSIAQDPARFTQSLNRDHKGIRIGWMGDYNGYLPTEPGVLELCRSALKNFESIGCAVDAVQPDFSMDRLWQCWLTLRGWMMAGYYGPLIANEKSRSLMPEFLVWEVEQGQYYTAAQIWQATLDRSAWYFALHSLFQKYDFLVLPSAQMFPFDAKLRYPEMINGKHMDTYHRWMEVYVGGSLSGLPVLTVPAGFNANGLPCGMQVVAPAKADLDLLKLGYAYEQASQFDKRSSPLLM